MSFSIAFYIHRKKYATWRSMWDRRMSGTLGRVKGDRKGVKDVTSGTKHFLNSCPSLPTGCRFILAFSTGILFLLTGKSAPCRKKRTSTLSPLQGAFLKSLALIIAPSSWFPALILPRVYPHCSIYSFFFATPTTCRSSGARDQTCATATQATAALTHWATRELCQPILLFLHLSSNKVRLTTVYDLDSLKTGLTLYRHSVSNCLNLTQPPSLLGTKFSLLWL